MAQAVTGSSAEGRRAPRIFLKKLVADVLDRVDQFREFNPRQHYALTIREAELTPVERQAMLPLMSTRFSWNCEAFDQLQASPQHHVVNSCVLSAEVRGAKNGYAGGDCGE